MDTYILVSITDISCTLHAVSSIKVTHSADLLVPTHFNLKFVSVFFVKVGLKYNLRGHNFCGACPTPHNKNPA